MRTGGEYLNFVRVLTAASLLGVLGGSKLLTERGDKIRGQIDDGFRIALVIQSRGLETAKITFVDPGTGKDRISLELGAEDFLGLIPATNPPPAEKGRALAAAETQIKQQCKAKSGIVIGTMYEGDVSMGSASDDLLTFVIAERISTVNCDLNELAPAVVESQ